MVEASGCARETLLAGIKNGVASYKIIYKVILQSKKFNKIYIYIYIYKGCHH